MRQEKQLSNEHGPPVYHVSYMEYTPRQKEELSISTVVMVTRCHKPRLNTSMYFHCYTVHVVESLNHYTN